MVPLSVGVAMADQPYCGIAKEGVMGKTQHERAEHALHPEEAIIRWRPRFQNARIKQTDIPGCRPTGKPCWMGRSSPGRDQEPAPIPGEKGRTVKNL